MSIHEKLAASVKDLTAAHAAEIMGVGDECCGPNPCIDCIIGAIKCGLFSDILGVSEPTLEDVKREAVRVDPTAWVDCGYDFNDRPCVTVYARDEDVDCDAHRIFLRCPTRASAYAALRALPDYEVSK